MLGSAVRVTAPGGTPTVVTRCSAVPVPEVSEEKYSVVAEAVSVSAGIREKKPGSGFVNTKFTADPASIWDLLNTSTAAPRNVAELGQPGTPEVANSLNPRPTTLLSTPPLPWSGHPPAVIPPAVDGYRIRYKNQLPPGFEVCETAMISPPSDTSKMPAKNRPLPASHLIHGSVRKSPGLPGEKKLARLNAVPGVVPVQTLPTTLMNSTSLVPLAAKPMSGGVSCTPATLALAPSPSVPDSGVPGVTVTDGPATAPPGEADAALEDDCGPRRSGMRTAPRFDGESRGSSATFTVPANGTDQEWWAMAPAPPARALAFGEATAGPARKPTTDPASRATAAPNVMMRLTNPPFGDGTGKVSHTKGRASTRRSGARPRIGSRVRPRRRRASDGRLRKEIIRCLKRYIAREIYKTLCRPKPPAAASAPQAKQDLSQPVLT